MIGLFVSLLLMVVVLRKAIDYAPRSRKARRSVRQYAPLVSD